jgi:2-methylcitrate dehydratase PrpD
LGVGLKAALKSAASQPLQVGRSTESGIVAACFAAGGAPGAHAIIEEGLFKAFAGDADTTPFVGLGREFSVAETYLKQHGGCRGNHAPTDVVSEIRRRHAFAVEDIVRVEVDVDTVTHAADVPVPHDGRTAQFSIAFSIACMLVHGDAALFRFTDAALAEASVQAIVGRVQVRANAELDLRYPERRGARVAIVLRDGRRLTGEIDNALGEPEHPLDPGAVQRKFLSLAAPRFGARAEQILEGVMRLDTLADARSFAASLGIA